MKENKDNLEDLPVSASGSLAVDVSSAEQEAGCRVASTSSLDLVYKLDSVDCDSGEERGRVHDASVAAASSTARIDEDSADKAATLVGSESGSERGTKSTKCNRRSSKPTRGRSKRKDKHRPGGSKKSGLTDGPSPSGEDSGALGLRDDSDSHRNERSRSRSKCTSRLSILTSLRKQRSASAGPVDTSSASKPSKNRPRNRRTVRKNPAAQQLTDEISETQNQVQHRQRRTGRRTGDKPREVVAGVANLHESRLSASLSSLGDVSASANSPLLPRTDLNKTDSPDHHSSRQSLSTHRADRRSLQTELSARSSRSTTQLATKGCPIKPRATSRRSLDNSFSVTTYDSDARSDKNGDGSGSGSSSHDEDIDDAQSVFSVSTTRSEPALQRSSRRRISRFAPLTPNQMVLVLSDEDAVGHVQQNTPTKALRKQASSFRHSPAQVDNDRGTRASTRSIGDKSAKTRKAAKNTPNGHKSASSSNLDLSSVQGYSSPSTNTKKKARQRGGTKKQKKPARRSTVQENEDSRLMWTADSHDHDDDRSTHSESGLARMKKSKRKKKARKRVSTELLRTLPSFQLSPFDVGSDGPSDRIKKKEHKKVGNNADVTPHTQKPHAKKSSSRRSIRPPKTPPSSVPDKIQMFEHLWAQRFAAQMEKSEVFFVAEGTGDGEGNRAGDRIGQNCEKDTLLSPFDRLGSG